jgi:hypothetical protein
VSCVRSAEYPERFSPDGLTEQIIDALLPLVWPRHPLPHPLAAERARPSARHHLVSGGGGLNPRDVHDTRPGGSGLLNHSPKQSRRSECYRCIPV